jgi:hypothetical protein
VLGAGEIKERQPNGLEDAEAGELGQIVANRQSPSLIAFRFQPAMVNLSERCRSMLRVTRHKAVLTANYRRAEYNTLIAADGKILVQSRFAVRNNQRNFLKLTLPPTAVLWSASVAGRPIRPGKAPDGSFLLPLEKTRSGEEAPAFIVEVFVSGSRAHRGTDKGHTRVSLVAVDLPISKSHLLLHHPPLFRVTASPGNFRIAAYTGTRILLLCVQTERHPQPNSSVRKVRFLLTRPKPKQLVAKLRSEKPGGRPARNLPLRVMFPHFGPSIFSYRS